MVVNGSSSSVTKKVFSRAAVQTVQLTHDTFGLGVLGGGAVDMHPEPFIGRLLRVTKTGETDVVVWDEPEGKVEASGGVLDLGDVDWEELCLMTKELLVLRVIPPLSLVKVGGMRICLTVDHKGLLAVYLGRCASVGSCVLSRYGASLDAVPRVYISVVCIINQASLRGPQAQHPAVAPDTLWRRDHRL
jgi:hypothetical protein